MSKQETAPRERLAYIVTQAHHGGAQTHVVALIEHFRHEYDVHLATGEEGYVTELARGWGVPVTIFRHLRPELSPKHILRDVRACWEIWRWLGAVQPTLLHAHSSKAGGLGRYAARARRVSTIFTAHGWGFAEGVPRFQKFTMLPAEWLVSRVTDAIIVVSQADRRLADRHRFRPRGQMITIHNGISPDAPASVPNADAAVRLLCVARFSPQKDQGLLIHALQDIEEPWHLTFVGVGRLEHDLRQFVEELGIEHRVDFLGARDDVADLLARADIFVLPSRWEGLPISILEAMRAGLPVVASDVGGVSETVIDGVTGYLVARADERTLCSRLERLIGDADLRREMGQKGRDLFLEQFVDTKMFGQVARLYVIVSDAHPR